MYRKYKLRANNNLCQPFCPKKKVLIKYLKHVSEVVENGLNSKKSFLYSIKLLWVIFTIKGGDFCIFSM